MNAMAFIHLVNDSKYFSIELVWMFIIKVAKLSAVLFSKLLLLVVLLFSFSLIKFRSNFVLVSDLLTYTFRSKISLHVEAEKRKMHINSNKPFKKKKMTDALKGKFTCGIGNTQRSWSLVFS